MQLEATHICGAVNSAKQRLTRSIFTKAYEISLVEKCFKKSDILECDKSGITFRAVA